MPTATSVTAAGVTAGAFTLTGSFLGMQHDYLVAGFLGGAIALSFINQSSILRMATSVLTSAVLGAYGAPVAAAVISEHFPYAKIGDGSLPFLCAVSIGVCAQTLVPAALNFVRKFSGGQQ